MPDIDLPEEFLMAVLKRLKPDNSALLNGSIEGKSMARHIQWQPAWGPEPVAGGGMASLIYRAGEMLFKRGLIEGYENTEESGLYRISAKGLFYLQEHQSRAAVTAPVMVAVQRPSPVAAPASDRLVPLNHNAPEYQAIADGIVASDAIVAGDNELTEADKSRIRAGLAGAASLWKATELKRIQIQIGVIMALEDAASAINATTRKLGIKLVIDLIYQFLQAHLAAAF